MSEQKQPASGAAAKRGNLKWWQLTLLGMGFTTGTGFFLGSAVALDKAGFAVIALFLVAAVGIYFIFDALAQMIAQQAKSGSFRAYTKEALGHWAGFSHGWVYWSSEMLIIGSQLTALGLFSRFWYAELPLWVYAAGYAVLGVAIVLMGQSGFEKAENVFAVVKVSALLMFIVLACLVIPGVLGQENAHIHPVKNVGVFFEEGWLGMWSGLIFVFFAFAGIEVMGLMATELNEPKDAPKSGKVMISIITALYLVSITLALILAPPHAFSTDESPFVTALKDLHYQTMVHIFNGVLIVAGFSSLVASLFSTTKMMYTIAKDGDAPKLFAKQNKRKLPYMSLLLTVTFMTMSVVVALLLPKQVYEYITTAGGIMLLVTWLFMVLASRKLLKLTAWGQAKSIIAIALIALGVTGTLLDENSRPGFFASAGFIGLILGVAWVLQFTKWKGGGSKTPREEPEDGEASGGSPGIRRWRRRRALQK